MHGRVSIGLLKIEPPLVNGSGVIDAVSLDEDWNLPDAVLGKLGAFTTKTVTSSPRHGNPQPWADSIGPGMLANAAGLPNPGIDAALRDWAVLPARLGIPIIFSIGGSADELPELAAHVSAAGWASAIELNLSCPNVDGGLVAAHPTDVAEVVSRVRARTSLPLIAKLTPACGAIAAVARAAADNGADALTCINTMPIRALAPGTGHPLLGAGPDGGMSGTGLHPIALRAVAEARAAVVIPIIGLGGVDSIDAARRMRDAGATIIGLGTGLLFDPGLIDTLRTAQM
ncbi:MAG: dihydroorotate dehydrogenase [Gaiellales bacterium]